MNSDNLKYVHYCPRCQSTDISLHTRQMGERVFQLTVVCNSCRFANGGFVQR